MQINLTESSRVKFNQLNPKAIRLYIKSTCWSGAILGVAPDEKKEDDEMIFSEGHAFVIEKNLYEMIPHDVTIDYKDKGLSRGFKVYLN